MKKILTPVVVLLICITVIWKWTLGFSSFTIFSYTLNTRGQLPRQFPDLQLVSHEGNVFHVSADDKYVLINFVYLNCPYVCHKVNNQIEDIYSFFGRTTIPATLEFVTVSFDLDSDGIEKISRYRSHFGDGTGRWTFALPYRLNQADFDRVLHQIGVWKYTVPATGVINHGIYLFLLDPDNRIVRVFDPGTDSTEKIVQQIEACISGKTI